MLQVFDRSAVCIFLFRSMPILVNSNPHCNPPRWRWKDRWSQQTSAGGGDSQDQGRPVVVVQCKLLTPSSYQAFEVGPKWYADGICGRESLNIFRTGTRLWSHMSRAPSTSQHIWLSKVVMLCWGAGRDHKGKVAHIYLVYLNKRRQDTHNSVNLGPSPAVPYPSSSIYPRKIRRIRLKEHEEWKSSRYCWFLLKLTLASSSRSFGRSAYRAKTTIHWISASKACLGNWHWQGCYPWPGRRDSGNAGQTWRVPFHVSGAWTEMTYI